MMDELDQNEEQLLTAEYALGLLTPQEAAAFEVLLSEDAFFRAEYARWAQDFAAMTDEIAPVTPPDDMLTRIRQAVFVPQVDTEGFVTVAVNEVTDTVAQDAPPIIDTPAQDRQPVRDGEKLADKAQGWLQRMGLLPPIAGGLIAALAVLWLVNVSGVMAPVPDGAVTLASADNALVVEVTYMEDAGTLDVARTAGAIPAGQSIELWLFKDDLPPVSLGVLPMDENGTLQVAENVQSLLRGASCAISIEPLGGSPTGAPTSELIDLERIVWS